MDNSLSRQRIQYPCHTSFYLAIPLLLGPGEVETTSKTAEDKMMFTLHADASTVMTVARIRRVYGKFDSKAVATQLSTASQENSTPVRMLINSASHLSGAARTFGAVLIGHMGVHMFHPQPVAKVLNDIGGMSILLGFVAMANDVEGLYAAVKALVCVMKSTNVALQDMLRINGYQVIQRFDNLLYLHNTCYMAISGSILRETSNSSV